ncbi:MAG TPA: plastocyanin/azurin family copper-binding protein, partial [Dehalococcoidia bacterium]|nr:plastocyanin/azurin family copper-binding protein [Dehalococcoidia bacterium]
MRTLLAAMSALLIVTAITIVHGSSPPLAEAADHTVTVADNSFTPATLNITAGDTVIWTLSSGTHTVVADDGSFSSGILDSAGFSHTFTTPGTYEYFCSVHSSANLNLMNGVINVAAAQAGPTNTPVPQATNTPQPEPTGTPAADATDTPVATPTTAAEAAPTAVDAAPIAAPAGEAP